jgi:hypothetical protein
MTMSVALGRRTGLINPMRSTAQSEPALTLARLADKIREHLLDSYAVRGRAERTLDELELVRQEASVEGWDGYEGKPMHPDAYLNAKLFIGALPTTAPPPEVSADPDGDVALDWFFAPRKALSVSISGAGRCTFAWIFGHRTFRGTDWVDDDGIPENVANALWQLASEVPHERPAR